LSQSCWLVRARQEDSRTDEGVLLTGRIVGLEDKDCRSAMELVAGVEDHFVRWYALASHSGSHTVRRAVNDEVAEQLLALPESVIVGFGQVELSWYKRSEKCCLALGKSCLRPVVRMRPRYSCCPVR
jgi:hypothetical protein